MLSPGPHALTPAPGRDPHATCPSAPFIVASPNPNPPFAPAGRGSSHGARLARAHGGTGWLEAVLSFSGFSQPRSEAAGFFTLVGMATGLQEGEDKRAEPGALCASSISGVRRLPSLPALLPAEQLFNEPVGSRWGRQNVCGGQRVSE